MITRFATLPEALLYLAPLKPDRIPSLIDRGLNRVGVEVETHDCNSFYLSVEYATPLPPDAKWDIITGENGEYWYEFSGEIHPNPADRVRYDAKSGWVMFSDGRWHKASLNQAMVYLRGHDVEKVESVIASRFDAPWAGLLSN